MIRETTVSTSLFFDPQYLQWFQFYIIDILPVAQDSSDRSIEAERELEQVGALERDSHATTAGISIAYNVLQT